MCDRHRVLRSLLVGTLLFGCISAARAQGNGRTQSCSASRSSYCRQPAFRSPNWYAQQSTINPSYMNYYVGRAQRHNAYQQARLQGMQIRFQQERLRGEIARVRHQNKLERRFASLKQPQLLGRSRHSASVRDDSGATPTATTADSLLLTEKDVEALRNHHHALAEIQLLRWQQFMKVFKHRRTRLLPSQFDRASGRASWPALLTDDSRLREDVQYLNGLLADWAQAGHDPTSLAALQVRKVVERMIRDLVSMLRKNRIDGTAYGVTREFLENTAYETRFSGCGESGQVPDTLASTH